MDSLGGFGSVVRIGLLLGLALMAVVACAADLHGERVGMDVCLDRGATKPRGTLGSIEQQLLSALYQFPNASIIRKEACDPLSDESFSMDSPPREIYAAAILTGILDCEGFRRREVAKELAKRLQREWRLNRDLTASFYLYVGLANTGEAHNLEVDEQLEPSAVLTSIQQRMDPYGILHVASEKDSGEAGLTDSNSGWALIAHLLEEFPELKPLADPQVSLEKFTTFVRQLDFASNKPGSKWQVKTVQAVARAVHTYFKLRRALAWGADVHMEGEMVTAISHLIRIVNDSQVTDAATLNMILVALKEADNGIGLTGAATLIAENKNTKTVELKLSLCSAIGLPVGAAEATSVYFVDEDKVTHPESREEKFERASDGRLFELGVFPREGMTPAALQEILQNGFRVEVRVEGVLPFVVRTAPMFTRKVEILSASVGVSPPSAERSEYQTSSVRWTTDAPSLRLNPMPIASAAPSGRLHVSARVVDKYTMRPIRPTQVAIMLTLSQNAEGRLPRSVSRHRTLFMSPSHFFGHYILDIPLNDKRLLSFSGSYRMSVVVGDAISANPLVLELAELSLTFSSQLKILTVPTSLVAKTVIVPLESDWHPKEVIHHTFAAERIPPSSTVTSGFLLLTTLLPLAVLAVATRRFGVNCNAFPSMKSCASRFALHTAFQCVVILSLLLILLYWWKLSLFTALKAFIPVGVAAVWLGNRVMCDIRAHQLDAAKKAA